VIELFYTATRIWQNLLIGDTFFKADSVREASAQVLLAKGQKLRRVSKQVEKIFNHAFGDISRFCPALARGKYPVCLFIEPP
jgi:hypothetical protein